MSGFSCMLALARLGRAEIVLPDQCYVFSLES